MASIERTRLHRTTFLVIFALAAYLFWRRLERIWMPVFLGLVIAVGIYPLHERLLRKLGGKHPGIPAAMATALAMIAALGVMAFLVLVVGHRVVGLAQDVAKRYQDRGATGVLGNDIVGILSRLGVQPEDLQTAITSYYLLRGSDAASWLVEVVPLPNWEVALIVRDVRDVTRAMLFSTAVMTIYQGVTAGIGYRIFGVDSPLVWAALTGIASIMPAVGTAIIWAPATVFLMVTGHVGQGLAVLAWSLVFVADYILRPKLVGTRIKMNDLLVFIAIFGGIEAYGVLGIVLGPVTVAVFLALIRIYQREYRPEGPVRAHDITAAERPMHQ
jgi:predicted PurR-regulated permease PerM